MDQKNRPVETFRDGRLKATIWQNESDKGAYHTVSLSKVFEDQSGQLRETNSFSAGELLRVAELARESHAFVREVNRSRSVERSQQQQMDHSLQR